MSKSRFDLEEIIDLEKWEKLQDALSLVTKMAILTVDYKGIVITSYSIHYTKLYEGCLCKLFEHSLESGESSQNQFVLFHCLRQLCENNPKRVRPRIRVTDAPFTYRASYNFV